MQFLILTLLVAAASALNTNYGSYGSYGSYGYPYYSNYGGYGGALYGHSYGSGAVNYDLGGYGTGYGSSYSYQPASLYSYGNYFRGFSFPTGPAQISFVMGSPALRKNPEDKTIQKTINSPDFSTKQTNVQTDINVSNEDVNYDENFFGSDENLDDFESVFEEKSTVDRTSQQPSKTGAPKNKGHSSSTGSSSHTISSHDSRRTKTPTLQEPAVIPSDSQQSRKQSNAKSSIPKGDFPSYPSLYSPTSNRAGESPIPSRPSTSDESKFERVDESTFPERYSADRTYSTLKGQKNTAPSNTFVEVPDNDSKDFNAAVNSNNKQFPNQQHVTEQKQTNSKTPVYDFPPRQTRHKSTTYGHLIPVVPVLTPDSPIIYDQGYDIPVEYVV